VSVLMVGLAALWHVTSNRRGGGSSLVETPGQTV
jgi:hypothetical protein